MSDSDETNDGSDQNDLAPHLDPAALRKRLQALLGDDTLAYVDLELPPQPAPDKAREKHNARTASYKQAQALQLAPNSEAIRQATSNVLLSMLLAHGPATEAIFIRSMLELTAAGYDQEESKAALLRLLTTYPERRTAWQRRTRQKLGRAVVKQLRELDE
jgi:hypothetical protein